MHRTQNTLIMGTIALVALIAGVMLSRFLAQRDPRVSTTTATVIVPARPLPDFKLVDQDGASFDKQRLVGRFSILFFGFTSCPDVCPTTLQTLSQVEKSLLDLPQAKRPQIVLISVDPERDTPERLRTYVQHFNGAFAGATGTLPQLETLTRYLGVPFAKSEVEGGTYTVDHSAALFLINARGEFAALFSTPHTQAAIAADYRLLVAGS